MAPDLLRAAMDKLPGRSAVMIGDSTWDFVAAGKAGIPSYAVRTGGFSAGELRAAGAKEVFESLGDLQRQLDDTLLARPG